MRQGVDDAKGEAMKDEDEPAFPTDYHFQCPECKTEGWQANAHGGMTLRDYFAGQSLLQVCSADAPKEERTPEKIAAAAYAVADAMLQARKAGSVK